MTEMDHSGRPEPSGASSVTAAPWRGRAAVAASILAALFIGTYFAAAPGGLRTPWTHWLLNVAILGVAFWLPALRIGSVADVTRRWMGLLAWAAAWTVVWDVTTSGVLLRRELFQEWWIVYPAGILTLLALFLLHGAVVGRYAPGSGRALEDGPGAP